MAKCARLERCLEQAVPDATQRTRLLGSQLSVSTDSSPWGSEVAPPSYRSNVASPSEEPPSSERGGSKSSPRGEHRVPNDEDRPGRFLGPTSGASCLGHVKDFMASVFSLGWSSSDCPSDTITLLDSVGRFQTHDPARPLIPRHEARPAILPRRAELNAILTELGHFLPHAHNDFYCGGVLYWGSVNPSKLDPDLLDALPGDAQECRQLAFIHSALAVICVLDTPPPTKNNANAGDAFFERAKSLMGNPLDAKFSMHDLPLLNNMAVYLIEVNRTDAAYIYISLGMHIAITHGAHRGCVQDEQEKRAFWTLYLLDRWLCVLLGRPPTLMDESIDLALPTDRR